MHPNLLLAKPQNQVFAFLSAHHIPNPIYSIPNPLHRTWFHWEKPPHGFLKVNWDFACRLEEGRYGFGAIIRDEQGWDIRTMRAIRNFNVSPLVTEAYGFLLFVLFYQYAGISKFIVEGDSLQVINLIHSRGEQWSQAEPFIQDGISMVNSFCSWSAAKHKPRVTY